MRTGLGALAATIALAIVAAALPAAAGATELRLLVEGPAGTRPLFDGPVETVPHAVDGGDGSGSHPCWGPPGAERSPTPTGALDDAMRAAGISWRGNWNPSFGDFFIDRIGPYESAEPDRYWSISVRGRHTAGGCLTALREGDEVRFRYGSLFGEAGETGGPAEDEGTNPGGTERDGGDAGPEGGGGGAVPARPRLHPRLAARRAHRFLRRALRRGGREVAGVEWAHLALATRRGRGAPGAAFALLGPRLRTALRPGRRATDPNATALAVLAVGRRRPLPAAQAARGLVAAQLPSGGFGYRGGAPPDVDTTGVAAWALAVSGRRRAARRAAGFLLGAQTAGGGFGTLPGAEPNAQSTGMALAGLRAAGGGGRLARATRRATVHLTSLARPDGSFAYAPGTVTTPVWTTAQALLGLTTRPRLLFRSPYR